MSWFVRQQCLRRFPQRRPYSSNPFNLSGSQDLPIAAGLPPKPLKGSAPFKPKQIYARSPVTANANYVLNTDSEASPPHIPHSTDKIHPSETSVIPSMSSLSSGRRKKNKKGESIYLVPPEEDPLLHFISSLIMVHGKRSQSNARVSKMLLHINAMTRAPALPIVRAAMEKVSPLCKTLHHKSPAGKQVSKPVPLTDRQSKRRGFLWILEASNYKDGVGIEERLAKEIIAVIQGTSDALNQRVAAHKMGMVNRGQVLKTKTTM